MYKKEYETLLRQGRLPRSLFIWGDAPYMRAQAVSRLLDALGQEVETAKFYYGDYNPKTVKALLGESSLFGDKTAVLLKIDGSVKLPKGELSALVDAAARNDDATLIIDYDGSNGKELEKLFTPASDGWAVRFFPPLPHEATAVLQEESAKRGLEMPNYLAGHLLQLHRDDLALCVAELDKLAIPGRPLTVRDLDEMVYGLGEIDMDDLFYRLLDKEEIAALADELADTLDGGEIRLLNALQGFITQLFMFHTYIKVNGQPDPMKILGYSPPRPVVERKAKAAIRLTVGQFGRILSLLLDAETQLKSPLKSDKRALLLSTLMKIKTIL